MYHEEGSLKEKKGSRKLRGDLRGGRCPGAQEGDLHLKALLLLMHEGNGRLMFVGQLHEVTPGRLLCGKAFTKQSTLPVHLADDQKRHNQGRKQADTEAKDEEGHTKAFRL